MEYRKGLIALFVASIAACGNGEAPPPMVDDDAAVPIDAAEEPASTSFATFRPGTPGAGLAWNEVPFPSDLYLDADGKLALTTLPSGVGADAAFSELMITALGTLDRFAPHTNIYFPVEGDLDATTLVDHVKLVDLEDGLAEIPIEVKWRGAMIPGTTTPDLSSIVVVLRLGVALEKDHAYAAYVTRDVRATDGTPLGRAPDFEAAIDLDAEPATEAIAAARATLRPLIDRLPEETVRSLAVATVFHTGDVSRDILAMRSIVASTPPAVTVTEVRTDLDFFFGVQDPAAAPGYSDLAVYEGRPGKRPQPHGNIAAIVHGTIGLTSFSLRSDLAPKLLEYDALGRPEIETTLVVPFTIVLPNATSYANLPVMVYAHGVNRTRVDSLILADSAAARGIATFSIDLMFHGSRALNSTDFVNFITGEQTPDGFGDPIGLFAPIRFFHLADNGEVPAYHPLVMRANLMQSSIDICSVVSYVENGDVTAIRTALADAGFPADLSFHDDTVLQGESFGSMLGAVALAIDPEIEAAVFNVLPAGFAWPTLLHSGAFSGIFGGIVLDSFAVRDRIVLGDPDYDARWDPMVMIWNYALASGDPANYAHAVRTGELRGNERASILLSEAWSDEIVPNSATEHFAGGIGLPSLEMGLPSALEPSVWGVPMLRFVALPQVAGPLTSNLGDGATGALALWYPATHGINMWYEDKSDLVPYHPPFIERIQPVQFVNFTPQLHRLWGDFLASFFATGTPTLVDPFATP